MTPDVDECLARVKYWVIATSKAEWAWLKYDGEPHEKEKRRRAYEFADRILLGWERKLELARAKSQGLPLLRLVGT